MKIFSRKLAGVVAALGAAGALALVAASPAAANVGGGNVQVTWSIPGWPPEGLSDVSFPMTVAPTTSRQPGTYYAELFNFTDSTYVGYTGLQPRPDLNGSERIRGVFSSFMPGTVTDHPNCADGADGGPGVSCGLEFDAVYGRTYDLRVERTAPRKWTGTAVDTVTGAEVEIGSWTVPALGGLKGTRTSGFVEHYSSVAQCSQMPYVDVTFGAPRSASAGLTGNVGFSMEYADCVGQGALTHTTVGSGVRVTRGFVQPPLTTAVSLNTGVNNRCLDVPSSKWENGTVVAMWSCNYNNNQRWSFTSTGQLQSNKTCLQTQTPNPLAGDRVIIQDCDNSKGQLWDYVDGAIVARTSGLCLQLDPGNSWAVSLGTCNGSAGQKWRAMNGANQPVATDPAASQTRSTTLREGRREPCS
ncbi:RICIN domain-containing protein [Leifsonia poae]|uniref:RICIN domain-containing protein n=1 Tax=Leifsonia poae TaxID=110933 RepID=UPI003D68F8D0